VSDRHTNALGGRMLVRGIGWRATFGVRGVQAVLNGIPLTTADGASVLNIIDPDVVKRIEVIRGPSSTYWGNSSGGVLYLSTQPNYARSDHYRIRMFGGSYGLAKGIIQYHQQFNRNKISAYSSYQAENGYRDYSASRLFIAGLQGSYKISNKSHLQYTGAFFSMPKAENPSALTARQVAKNPKQANSSYVQHESGKQARQGQLGLNYYRNTSIGLITLTGYGILRNLTNPLPFAIIHVDRLAGGFRGTVQQEIHHFQIKGGIELKTQHDNRHEFQNNEGQRGTTTVNEVEKVGNKAIFLNGTYRWRDLKLKGGLRYDWITFETDAQNNVNAGQRTFHALSPTVGVSFHPGSVELYTNLSTAFEAPTTTELTNRPGGGNGFNPDLTPEHTLGLEVGSRGNIIHNLWTFDVALYRMWIDDLLFPYQLEPNGAEFYRNEGKTRHSGVELSTSVNPAPQLQLRATYNFIYAQFRKAQTLDSLSLKGKAVPGIPRHRLNTSITWTPASFWIRLNNQFASSYAVNDINSVFNDAYWTFGVDISYKYTFSHSGTSIIPFINLNNIFDERYNGAVSVGARGGKYFYPAPGRNWRAGVSISF
jgi:iron complex outermembrane receptor protein